MSGRFEKTSRFSLSMPSLIGIPEEDEPPLKGGRRFPKSTETPKGRGLVGALVSVSTSSWMGKMIGLKSSVSTLTSASRRRIIFSDSAFFAASFAITWQCRAELGLVKPKERSSASRTAIRDMSAWISGLPAFGEIGLTCDLFLLFFVSGIPARC